jgi:hypothetical protein
MGDREKVALAVRRTLVEFEFTLLNALGMSKSMFDRREAPQYHPESGTQGFSIP